MIDGLTMVGLYTVDFDASLGFYRDLLGIPLAVDQHGDYHHAEHSFRDPYFHFAIFPAGDRPRSGPLHLSLSVDDCARVVERLREAGVAVASEPSTVLYGGGGTSAVVRDPDGNEVELFERAASAGRA